MVDLASAGRVAGKVAFVTGAARNQGRSDAVRLASEGADIIAVDVCAQLDVPYKMPGLADLDETVRQVEALGRRIVASQADVRDSVALDRAVADGVKQLGHLDIVVANAGISSFGDVQMSDSHWQEMIDINLTGVWRTIKASVEYLSDGGSIVITSSTAGLKGYAGLPHYVTAKHGLVGLMRSMAHELGPRRIRVNTVHPTQVPTDMLLNDETYRKFSPQLEHPTIDDFAAASQSGMVLPVPWVEPIDVSNAVLFLASDESRYITGVTLPVDAGNVIK